MIYDKGGFQWLLRLTLKIKQALNHNLGNRLHKADKSHFWIAFKHFLPVMIVDGSEIPAAGVHVDCLLEFFPIQAVLDGIVASKGVSQSVALR